MGMETMRPECQVTYAHTVQKVEVATLELMVTVPGSIAAIGTLSKVTLFKKLSKTTYLQYLGCVHFLQARGARSWGIYMFYSEVLNM